MGDNQKSRWLQLNKLINYLMPLILILLAIYLYSSFLNPIISKRHIELTGYIIMVFFIMEVIVKYALSEDYKYFLRNYWTKLLLVIPFFKGLRILKSYKIVAGIGKSLKTFKIIPKIQKLIKIPKVLNKVKQVILKYLKDND